MAMSLKFEAVASPEGRLSRRSCLFWGMGSFSQRWLTFLISSSFRQWPCRSWGTLTAICPTVFEGGDGLTTIVKQCQTRRRKRETDDALLDGCHTAPAKSPNCKSSLPVLPPSNRRRNALGNAIRPSTISSRDWIFPATSHSRSFS